MQMTQTGVPMKHITTDILEGLPLTEKGRKYILVLSVYYSTWVESFPVKTMKAETVAKSIVKQFIMRLGVPSVIQFDQSSQFTKLCKLLRITKIRAMPYHRKSDGMVESCNKT